jgi:hypothetical protein
VTLLVVLGAGASYDCYPWLDHDLDRQIRVPPELSEEPLRAQDVRPPLTQELFGNRRSFARFINDYSAVRPLVMRLRATDGTTALEDELADYSAKVEDHPMRQRHLTAMRFYLRDVLWLCTEGMLSVDADAGLTNHVHLVQTLYEWAERHDEHVCCVSFNYDTLLEQACHDVWGFLKSKLEYYVQEPRFSVLKPHGSMDWTRGLLRDGQPQGIWGTRVSAARSAISMIKPESEFTDVLPSMNPFSSGYDGGSVAPAMAPPIRDKTDFMWPDDQAGFFAGLRQRVTRLITIGWRAADKHFADRLTATFEGLALPTLVVTGGPGADSEADLVVQNLGIAFPGSDDNVRHWTGGFSRLIQEGVLEEWLPR